VTRLLARQCGGTTPVVARDFSLIQKNQTVSGAHPAGQIVGIGVHSRGYKSRNVTLPTEFLRLLKLRWLHGVDKDSFIFFFHEQQTNKMLRRLFGPKRDEVTGEWRRLHNKELYALYSSRNVIRVIK
jgi:hypothetical protein